MPVTPLSDTRAATPGDAQARGPLALGSPGPESDLPLGPSGAMRPLSAANRELKAGPGPPGQVRAGQAAAGPAGWRPVKAAA